MARHGPDIQVVKVGDIYVYHIEQEGFVTAFTLDQETFNRLRLAEEQASQNNAGFVPRKMANEAFEIR